MNSAAYNNQSLSSYISVGQKFDKGLTGLKSSVNMPTVLPGCSRGKSIALDHMIQRGKRHRPALSHRLPVCGCRPETPTLTDGWQEVRTDSWWSHGLLAEGRWLRESNLEWELTGHPQDPQECWQAHWRELKSWVSRWGPELDVF